MNMTDVLKRYEPDLKQLEENLGKYLHSAIPFIPTVINHLITSGGKRFRPSCSWLPRICAATAGSGATPCRR